MICALTITEVVAAFWGKVHRNELSGELASVLDRALADDLRAGRFVVVGVDDRVVRASLDAARRHHLRGADALQLAAASTVRAAAPSITAFAAFDLRLRAAAAAEGFALLPQA